MTKTIKQFRPDPKTGIPSWHEVPIKSDPVASAQGIREPTPIEQNPAVDNLAKANERLAAENQQLRDQLAKQVT